MKPWPLLVVVVGVACGCSSNPPQPVSIDTANDVCAHCRMHVSDPRTAAQILAPGEEPRIFDDIGCLRDALNTTTLVDDAVIYVAEHHTGSWLRAHEALYTQTTLQTPMGSGIVAHANTASRDADAVAASGRPIAVADILGRAATRRATTP